MSALITRRAWRSTVDLVPIADRLRALAIWRAAVLGPAAVAVAVVPSLARAFRLTCVIGVIAFVLISGVLTRESLRRNRGSVPLVRLLMMGDSVAIVALSFAAGGPQSPLRYLVILQAVEVTLLASFRMGLSAVTWQSFVVSGMYAVGHQLAPSVNTFTLTGDRRSELIGIIGCAWIAALTTASMAAANERELRRRRYDLEQLSTYHTAIADADNVVCVSESFVRAAVEEFGMVRVIVALPETDGCLKVLAAAGVTLPPRVLEVVPGSLAAEAALAACTTLVRGLGRDTDGALLAYFPPDARLVAMPVRTSRGRGVVLLEPSDTSSERVERRVVSMLERYRDDLESRVSNLWMIDLLRHAATTDALTGLVNRGRLRKALHAETQESVRRGQPLSVIILDVDHFKRVNDTHGHATGDEVLCEVAKILVEGVRPYDTVARYGGEEFVVLLPGLDLPEAGPIAERLRSTIASSTSPVPVTISLGVVRFDPAVDDEDRVIARADALLYEAKRNGRNQVRIAAQARFPQPLPPPSLATRA